MTYPIRITLRVGVGAVCHFTALLRLCVQPQKGDKLILQTSSQIGITIVDVYHFIPNAATDTPVVLYIAAPMICDSYDDMLRLIDWFKATHPVENFDAESEPESYYLFYRNLIHVLGLNREATPLIAYDPLAIKIFAEGCRSVLLAELHPDSSEFDVALIGFNPTIHHLCQLVLNRKLEEPAGADMLNVVKIWEQLLNSKRLMQWAATSEQCIECAKLVFSRIKSIPADKLPLTVRN